MLPETQHRLAEVQNLQRAGLQHEVEPRRLFPAKEDLGNAEGLKSKESEFEVWCCTEASIKRPEADWVPLDLNQKYFRALIESITIAREPNLKYINKQYENPENTK